MTASLKPCIADTHQDRAGALRAGEPSLVIVARIAGSKVAADIGVSP